MPIKLNEFVEKYDGKPVEVAGSANAKFQCVDLANAYLKEVLDQPIVEWTNARDFPSKLKENFDWFLNDPEAIPKPGDLMIWQHNEWGHISICTSAQLNEFYSFDQNYPTGTGCHLQRHTYLRPKVAGWLRFNGVTEDSNLEACLKSHKDLLDQLTEEKEKHAETKTQVDECKTMASHRKRELLDFISEIAEKLTLPTTSDKGDILGSIERLLAVEDQLTQAQKKLIQEEKKHDLEKSEFLNRIKQLELANEGIQTQLNLLKEDISKQKEKEADFQWFQRLINLFKEKK